MFKVTKEEYVNRTFRIKESLIERLGDVAQRENISVNALVMQCCEYALDHMESDGRRKKAGARSS